MPDQPPVTAQVACPVCTAPKCPVCHGAGAVVARLVDDAELADTDPGREVATEPPTRREP